MTYAPTCTDTLDALRVDDQGVTRVAQGGESAQGFKSVDPLAHEYSHVSPYTYVLNDPINAIDPDGMRVVLVNDRLTMLRHFSRIQATASGRHVTNHLISSPSTYNVESTFFTASSQYDRPSRTVYSVGSPWRSSIGGGRLTGAYALRHEINHAYDVDRGAGRSGKLSLEMAAVRGTNNMRSEFGESEMRTSYKGVFSGLSDDPEVYGVPGNVQNFAEQGAHESESGAYVTFSYSTGSGEDFTDHFGAAYTNSDGVLSTTTFNNREAQQVWEKLVQSYDDED